MMIRVVIIGVVVAVVIAVGCTTWCHANLYISLVEL